MLLIISQVIALQGNGAFINKAVEADSVNEHAITLDDLKAVNDDLNKVRESLNDINSNSELTDDHVEAIKVEAIKEEVKKVEAKAAEVKKLESKPAVVPVVPVVTKPAPVVVKKDKENIKPKQKISENKKVELMEKSPVVVIPVPVSSDSVTNQSIEKPADEVIIAADIEPAYIKYDINGKSLEDNNEQWTCVHDAKNGLMWEVKSKDNTMRNSENLYSWYNPERKTLQGEADGGRCKGDADCDTHSYIQEMNKQNYCGHNDWHLPTREQMQTLVNFEGGDIKTKINNQYFPRTMPSWYWTSSEHNKKNDYAWYVLFRNGHALSDLKERPKHVRLVRVTMTNLTSK
jgi:hypothetical protein